MLAPKSLLYVLAVVLSASDVIVALPADDTSAVADANPLLLEKRSCPGKKKMYSWNAGCSSDWAGRCYDTCISQARYKGCCQFASSLIDDKCGWISKNCYCDCWIQA